MIELKENSFPNWLIGILMTFLIIIVYGYEIGTSDSVEFLPYMLTFMDKTLYSFDLFIQYHLKTPFNERYFFAVLTFYLTHGKEWIIFSIHVLSTFFLCTGVTKIVAIFLKDKFIVAFVSFISLIGLTKWNLAGTEMYCPIFEGSLVEFTFTVWAFWFMLQKRWWVAGFLTMFGVLFQPQIGLNFFILYSITGLGNLFLDKNKSTSKGFLLAWIVFGILIGSYIIGILFGHYLESPPLNHSQYMKIAYEFRLRHHVYPAYFSRWGIILTIIFIPISLVYFFNRSKLVFLFMLGILLGNIIYLFGIYDNNYWIMTSWWMRTDSWTKLFGPIAILGFIVNYINTTRFYDLFKVGLVIIFILGIWFKFSPQHYDFLPNQKQDLERDICLEAQKVLPKNATCIVPFQFTALPYYGKLSSYVSFKAIPKRADYLLVWYTRLQEVYSIDTNMREKGFLLTEKANSNYCNLTGAQLKKLYKNGVTHMITYANTSFPQLKLITRNKEYAIYKLN